MIIISGMGRSGTSWLAKIFDSHPDTLYRHEPDEVYLTEYLPMFPSKRDFCRYRDVTAKYLNILGGMRDASITGKLPIFPKSYYSPHIFYTRKFFILSSLLIYRILKYKKSEHKILGDINIPDFIPKDLQKEINIVMKLNQSVGRLGLFARYGASCRVVHILRHPCGQIASVLRGEAMGKFDHADPHSEDYGIFQMLLNTGGGGKYGLTLEALQQMKSVERLAWRWLLTNEKAMVDIEGFRNCTTVLYEDLVAHPFATTKKLFEFADLEWRAQTENFIRDSTAVEKTNYYGLYKNPHKAATRWREEVSSENIDRIAAIVAQSLPGKLYF